MAHTNTSDGDILTAGSLNFHLNNRMSLGLINQTSAASTASGTNVTIKDVYITSGTFASGNDLMAYVQYRGGLAAGSSSSNPTYIVAVGPSGTSPTLTTVVSGAFTTATNASACPSLIGVGSTTVDSATVPALIRASSAQNGTSNTTVITMAVFGVDRL